MVVLGKNIGYRRELNAKTMREFFGNLRIKLALTTPYNLEGNGI